MNLHKLSWNSNKKRKRVLKLWKEREADQGSLKADTSRRSVSSARLWSNLRLKTNRVSTNSEVISKSKPKKNLKNKLRKSRKIMRKWPRKSLRDPITNQGKDKCSPRPLPLFLTCLQWLKINLNLSPKMKYSRYRKKNRNNSNYQKKTRKP